jgi:FAD/FMN-containing dehydrogenase/Fe-S oxidoreductase
MIDGDRTRIEADLRGLLDGDVYCDPLRAQLYASDASIYEIQPLGVVRPRHASDVQKCVQYAAENKIPLQARGGGTGLAGQSIGPGLVVDFSRYMRRLIWIDREQKLARVQPGLVIADLNRLLAGQGLLYGPDPATRSVTTIGSAIAMDTSGSHWLRYGSAGDTLESMQAVLVPGELAELAKHRWHGLLDEGDCVQRLARQVGQYLSSQREVLSERPWGDLVRGCGYRIDRCWDDTTIDLARLQSGAEGTLSLMTEATVRLEELPRGRAVVLLFFDRVEFAARAAIIARRAPIAACDMLDRRLIEIARETEPAFSSMLFRGMEAMLLVEMQGDDNEAARNQLRDLVNQLQRECPELLSSRIVVDPAQRDLYWRLCRRVVPRLYQLKGDNRPIPCIDDTAVPYEKLPEFLQEVYTILKAERVMATVFAHAAHGQVHIRPFIDLRQPPEQEKLHRLADRLYEKVMELGGVVAGEHAMGLSRTWYSRKQLGSWFPICRQIRRWFDAEGILNPGKLITDAPQRVTDNLRRQVVSGPSTRTAASANPRSRPAQSDDLPKAPSGPQRGVLPVLQWPVENDLAHVTQACNGCGRCRTSAPGERMCPMFRASREEESAPRAMANLMRGLLTGAIDPAAAESDELKRIADRCFGCHQCRIDCPASVDIPKLAIELKAQHVATHGLSIQDRLLARLDLIVAIAQRFPNLANWSLGNPKMRWLLEKSTGIAQGRRLPQIAQQSFLRWATRRRLHRSRKSPEPRVLYFVDTYANWHNPILAQSLVQVLQHQGINVFVPTFQGPSWMTHIAMGDIERARKKIRPLLRQLAESVRQGYQIVATEPSATLCLQREYLHLIDNEDARLVASHSWDAGSYLWQLHQEGKMERDFQPLEARVLYHLPCHLRALKGQQPGIDLLKMIPGIQVMQADAGCSGMAGTFGLKRANFRTSLRIGRNLIQKTQDPSVTIGSTECSACKLQMEQGSDRPTIHPIAILAHAYGLMPEVKKWIDSHHQGLVVR